MNRDDYNRMYSEMTDIILFGPEDGPGEVTNFIFKLIVYVVRNRSDMFTSRDVRPFVTKIIHYIDDADVADFRDRPRTFISDPSYPFDEIFQNTDRGTQLFDFVAYHIAMLYCLLMDEILRTRQQLEDAFHGIVFHRLATSLRNFFGIPVRRPRTPFAVAAA